MTVSVSRANANMPPARAGGMLAFALLTASVVLGLTLSGRARLRHWPRFAVEDVHRFVGLLAGGFVGVHVLALLVDTYVPFSLAQVLVPGASSYRPLATGLGVVALELLAALAVANRYRKRLSYRLWRRTHYLEFAVWGSRSCTASHPERTAAPRGASSSTAWRRRAWRACSSGARRPVTPWRLQCHA